MPAAHAALAWLAALTTLLVLVTAVATAMGRTASYRSLDRALLAQLALNGLAALAGLATLALAEPPGDPLHVLYGVLAPAAPIGARVAAGARGTGRPDATTIGRWVAVGALVALGSTVRSFMTGN